METPIWVKSQVWIQARREDYMETVFETRRISLPGDFDDLNNDVIGLA